MTLQDEGKVELAELSSQFYLKEDDVGKNRAEACLERLKELNTAVSVTAITEPISEKLLDAFQVLFFHLRLSYLHIFIIDCGHCSPVTSEPLMINVHFHHSSPAAQCAHKPLPHPDFRRLTLLVE